MVSNGLCRLSTGGGFGTRALYTNFDEAVFSGQRPIILNGIGDLASKPDLADRALLVTLPAIPAARRRTERKWERAFAAVAPEILGAVLDGVASALKRLSETSIAGAPRMADFAAWVTAAEPGLGWEGGSFLSLYETNREDAIQASIESDPVAQAVLKLMDLGPWEGPAADLLPELEMYASEPIKKSRSWPKTPSSLSRRLTQASPLLRRQGVNIERNKGGKDSRRMIFIRKRATE